ncbi:MAG: HupE/UreJ family protein [Betaproteobacteria bacterium]|nr:HupE/UreJ family protein [Betaproteobacteria bacterium]
MKHRSHRLSSFASILPALAFLLPTLTYAHVGIGQTAGFAHGFGHPLGGIDHVFAMAAVGLWAAQRGGRALWLIPATFVAIMALGSLIGTIGVFVPFVEQGIVLSVLVFGVLVAAAVRLPLSVSALIVGLFAVFHGYAHGAEMPANTSGLAYGAGFLLATVFLHGVGICAALLARRVGRSSLVRLSGDVIASCGVYLWLAA